MHDTSNNEFDWTGLTKSALIFVLLSGVYFFARSPGLDDYDSVQFAMGVRSFDLWQHLRLSPADPTILRGFLRMPNPWDWSVIALPALLLSIAWPLATANHRDDAPVQLVHYLEKLYPQAVRSRVVLLFSNRTQRHFQWYGPECKTIPLQRIPSTDALPHLTKHAVAIYTDDDQFQLPPGWRRVLVTEFSRNWLIYMKSHDVKLFRIEQS